VAVEPRGDLLHDRDMLLCGDHLCDMLVFGISWCGCIFEVGVVP
jgi:hypothetical protein